MLVNTLKRLYHACWYAFAIVVLITAVSVSIIRISLPYLNEYKQSVETWISNKSGYSISFDQINASWAGWRPHLVLDNVRIQDPDSNETLASFNSANISLNPFIAIIRQETPPLSIAIDGPQLTIIRTIDGAIRFSEKNQSNTSKPDNSGQNIFIGWLNKQRILTINNAEITFVDETLADKTIQMTGARLFFKKSSARMQVDILGNLPQNYGDKIQLSLDITGDITTPDWSGNIYLMASQVNPLIWQGYTRKYIPSIELTGAPVNLDIWSYWTNGNLDNINGILNTSNVELSINKVPVKLESLQTKFSANLHDKNIITARITLDKLVSENADWPETTLDLLYSRTDNAGSPSYYGKISYLDIADVYSLASKIPAIATSLPHVDRFNGTLENTEIVYKPETESAFEFMTTVNSLEIRENRNKLVFAVNDAEITGNTNHGTVRFDSGTVNAAAPGIIKAPVNLYDVRGQINWLNDSGNLVFQTPQFNASNPQFDVSIRGSVTLPGSDDSEPYVDIVSAFSNVQLDHIEPYLPLEIHEDVHHWLQKALISGRVPVADIAYRGNPKEFPFRENQGQFKVIADVEDARLDFAPGWMPVDSLQAQFRIDNNLLSVISSSAQIANAEISDTTATIKNLYKKPHTLEINGHVASSGKDALEIINDSPLSKNMVLKELGSIHPDGNIGLDLGLNIPLHPLSVDYQGVVTISGMNINSDRYGVALKNINGKVNFSNSSVSTSKLTGKYADQDVSINITTGEPESLSMQLSGISNPDFIISRIGHFFPKIKDSITSYSQYLTGGCDWTATLTTSIPQNGTTPTTQQSADLKVESDLAGLSIDLPDPVGKGYESRKFVLNTRLDTSDDKTITVDYGNDLKGIINLKKAEEYRLNYLELILGKDIKPVNPERGYSIHGVYSSLPLEKWFNLYNADKKDNSQPDMPVQVDLKLANTNFENYKFTNTRFWLDSSATDSSLTLDGDQVQGKITFPHDFKQAPVVAVLDKLQLDKNPQQTEQQRLDPRELPALDVSIKKFTYGDIQLGHTVLKTTKTDNGMTIDSLLFGQKGLKITGNGKWEYVNDQEESSFDVKIDASKLENMLSTFKYDVAPIEDGLTHMEMTANWNGSPMDFSWAKINGNLSMNIDKGRFLDIEPAAGRLFGLLSLQTLPRRLSLDFTDLFSKGFAFDLIDGTFTIENGNAYTNNLTMTGPSAKVDVTGRVGLKDKDYDQLVTVTPQFSDSLPVASALFGPIGMGVGAVIFLTNELFKSVPKNIDKLLRYQYTITGLWDDPVIKKYTKGSDNQS